MGHKVSKGTRRKMSLAKKGKMPKNINIFIEGGKKARFTSEQMRGNKINVGRTPWNKGTKGVMKAWNKGRTGIYSEETLKKMSESMKNKYKNGYVSPAKGKKYPHVANLPQNFRFRDMTGKNNPAYTGYQSKRHEIPQVQWLLIRNLILERDLFKCKCCGKTHHETILDIHHKIPYGISKDNSPKNLITLCRSCHKKADWEYLRGTQKIIIEDFVI